MGVKERIEQYGPMFEMVRQDVLAHASRTGHEKLIYCLKDAEGRLSPPLVEATGDERKVGVSDVEGMIMHMTGKHGVVIHSHPDWNPTSLSTDDIAHAAELGCETWALTNDGGYYWTGGKTAPGTSKVPLGVQAHEWASHVYELVQREAYAAVREEGFLTETEANLAGSHVMCESLAKKGLLLYEYVLGDKMQAALAKWEQWRRDQRSKRAFLRKAALEVLGGNAV